MSQDFNASFSKLDQIAVIDFLMSAASALHARNRLSQKETDQLKVVISGLQAMHQPNQGSFLLTLSRQGVSFIDLLENRWGARGLVSSLFRASAASTFEFSIQALIGLIQDLIKKSELFFNQRFATFEGDQLRALALAPEFLLGFSERLAGIVQELSETRDRLRTLEASTVACFNQEDLAAEQEFAEAIAFQFQIKNPTVASLEFSMLQNRVAQIYRAMIESMSVWFDFVRDNFKSAETNADLSSKTQWCLAELDKFQRLSTFHIQGDLTVLENQRYESNLSFYAINQILKDLCEQATRVINVTNFKKFDDISFSKNAPLRAALVQQLCAKGVSFSEAKKSIDQLAEYCFKNDTHPQKLIDSELAKINPVLATGFREILESLATTAQNGLISQSDLVKKARALSDSASRLGKVLIALAALILTSYCGLKTPVQSDVDILRPPVPFHAEAPQPPPPVEQPVKKDTKN